MRQARPSHTLPPGPASARTLAAVLEATGTERFGAVLLNHLQEAFGADYCAVFRLGPHAPSELVTGSHDGSATAHTRVSAYLQRQTWAKDPAMVHAQTRLAAGQTLLMRMDLSDIQDQDLRETIWPRIRDRVVIAGHSGNAAYSVSILREGRGGFTAGGLERMAESAQMLISVLAKHADLAGGARLHASLSGVISSVADMQACLAALSPLTPREADVCARILYGMTTTGIALDLGVGTETVKTFRKLAYRRLGIGSERELLGWYLGLQARWHTGGPQA
ncbi:MAG: LuxR C-terminal-related transcriptional regulator [Ramlibacter sp.]